MFHLILYTSKLDLCVVGGQQVHFLSPLLYSSQRRNDRDTSPLSSEVSHVQIRTPTRSLLYPDYWFIYVGSYVEKHLESVWSPTSARNMLL